MSTATTVRARRGDLIIVELRPSYTVIADGVSHREESTEYRLMRVTNLTRDGSIRMVRDERWTDQGAPQKFEGMLHRTGPYWLLPAADWDVEAAQRIAREHTYPKSTTPRCFPSLESARAALAPARRSS